MSQAIQKLRIDLENKTHAELLRIAESTKALVNKRKFKFLDFVWPSEGYLSRDNYPKVMDFYAAGDKYLNRLMGGGNGCGKTYQIGIEWVYHWTGLYPDWWKGKRMKNPKSFWIVAQSPQTYKESIQKLLLGNTLGEADFGTGLIPKDLIMETVNWPGAGGGVIQTIEIRHVKGHNVTVAVKSDNQESENLQAANLDGVWYDEEPSAKVYKECQARLRGTTTKPHGISIMGCTSLKGCTEVMLKYCPSAIYPVGQHPIDAQKYITCLDLETDCPHFSKESVDQYKSEYKGAELESRLRGAISMGEGQIYPYEDDQIVVKPFPIPDYWPRCFTLDFGYHVTCVLWGAKDPHTNTLYIYSEYYSKKHQTTQVHALNIKAKGAWIPGICDPSGGGRQDDGRLLADLFRAEGLDLVEGDNSQTGIARNCNMFENGSLKIFETCVNTILEKKLYHWDTKDPNKPARNQADHAMDCLKYKTSMFDYAARTEFDTLGGDDRDDSRNFDSLTGY